MGLLLCSCGDAPSTVIGGELTFDAGQTPPPPSGDGGPAATTNNPSAACQPGGANGGNTWTDLYACYFGPNGPDSCAGTGSSCHADAMSVGGGFWFCGGTSDSCYAGMSGNPIINPTANTSNPTSNGLYTILCSTTNTTGLLMPLGCPPSAVLEPSDMARIAAWLQAGGTKD